MAKIPHKKKKQAFSGAKILKRYLERTENIDSVMTRRVITIRPDESILHAAKSIRQHRIGSLCVVENKKLRGVLSERDIVTKVVTSKKSPAHILVKDVIDKNTPTAYPDDPISTVMRYMQKSQVRHVPIIDKKSRALLGIVSSRDLILRTQARMKYLIQVKDHYMTHDALTGLRNYRFFNDYLDIEITRSLYNNSSFSLLFMDLDHFKELNDTQGHPIGNLVLMRFGEIISQKRQNDRKLFSIRKSDVPVRFGGDEFSLILPDTNANEAKICAERLLRAVRIELNSLPGVRPPVPITISIGIATFPYDAQDRQTLIKYSDLALYEAKRRGKDQICLFTEISKKTLAKTQ